jgi:hypothetical protein
MTAAGLESPSLSVHILWGRCCLLECSKTGEDDQYALPQPEARYSLTFSIDVLKQCIVLWATICSCFTAMLTPLLTVLLTAPVGLPVARLLTTPQWTDSPCRQHLDHAADRAA